MKIITLFALVLSLGISNGYAEKYEGLRVKGDYKFLPLMCDVKESPLISKDEIIRTIKLKLLSFNIKTKDSHYTDTHDLYCNINYKSGSNVMNIYFVLSKDSKAYGISNKYVGPVFKPSQGRYASLNFATTKQDILRAINKDLDRFIVDYLESNMP